MSRLTSTEIVKKGDYLKPDFNPASLTVSQLIGVLGHHEIKYPTPYSKPRLIQLFNDTIKANVARYTTLTPEPSDDGITDGLTGEPINAPAVRYCFTVCCFRLLMSFRLQLPPDAAPGSHPVSHRTMRMPPLFARSLCVFHCFLGSYSLIHPSRSDLDHRQSQGVPVECPRGRSLNL